MKKKKEKENIFTQPCTTPNELNIEELMYRAKEWSCITAARI